MDLSQIRQELDAIDALLVENLNRRAELAQAIGKVKEKDGKPFFTPERERQVYERLMALNNGPLLGSQIQSIYREIISAARALEKPLRAAYWGPPGSYSFMAASRTFGQSSELAPYGSISDVFSAVEHGDADYGVVPVENSSTGVVPETLDMFPMTNVKICSELYVPIDHNLVSFTSNLSDIKRVYTGAQPQHQCQRWLNQNLPHAEIKPSTSSSQAASDAKEDAEGAAIASRLAAELLGIPIVAAHIQDSPLNRTRFLVIGFNEPAKTGRDKTSLMFNLRNKPGELYRALGALVNHDVNLLMIESRPAQRSGFEYLFFVDCIGHRDDDAMARAVAELKTLAMEMVVLGSYPSAESV